MDPAQLITTEYIVQCKPHYLTRIWYYLQHKHCLQPAIAKQTKDASFFNLRSS